jgi:lipopolysaccharide transport system permease protein
MSIMGFARSDLGFIVNLWRMNLADRYLGSALGGAWAILNPLLMFALFTFVFGYVFKARLPGADSTMSYSIWLICGYGPWLANTEALTAASNSIIGNAGLVKNMAFKTEVLPIAATLLGIVPLAVSVVFLLALQLITGEGWRWSLVFLPALVIVQFLFLAAFGILFAAITTFVRDFVIVLPNLLMIVLFATPIFYPREAVPTAVQWLISFNPIYVLASAYRAILLGELEIPVFSLIVLFAFSLILLKVSLTLFRRVKGYFPSVI